jgi:hypothetical protein
MSYSKVWHAGASQVCADWNLETWQIQKPRPCRQSSCRPLVLGTRGDKTSYATVPETASGGYLRQTRRCQGCAWRAAYALTVEQRKQGRITPPQLCGLNEISEEWSRYPLRHSPYHPSR